MRLSAAGGLAGPADREHSQSHSTGEIKGGSMDQWINCQQRMAVGEKVGARFSQWWRRSAAALAANTFLSADSTILDPEPASQPGGVESLLRACESLQPSPILSLPAVYPHALL